MRPSLHELEILARKAGEILSVGFGQQHRVDYKGVIDPVTEIDHRSEAFILGEIRKRFPDHRVVAEESGESDGNESSVWYVDPLDGTVNYTHGVPIFAVSLAYQEGGSIRLGVVYDPMQDECFSSEKGQGAWLNGKPIQVSLTQDLDHSLVVTGFPYDIRTSSENNLDNYYRFTLCTQGVRRLGSAALDLCYVASGRFDGYWEVRIGAWDIAAGALIAQEAGATVTSLRGSSGFLSHPQSILAANPSIHPQMLEVLKG